MSFPRSTAMALVCAIACIVAALAVVLPLSTPATKSVFGIANPSEIEATSFLPAKLVRDGSVDYTAQMQAAINAAAGLTLRLPPFPVRVSRRPGKPYCLIVKQGLTIRGSQGSRLVESQGAVIVLYCEGTSGLSLADFTLQGKGGRGQALGHGILQITGGSDVRVEGVRIEDSDADGLAIANATNVRVTGCSVERISKAGIYLSSCTRAVVSENLVSNVLGHTTAQGAICGSGLQLSGNVDLVCSSNVVADGVGIGILCNSNWGQRAPSGCVIVSNRVRGFANPASPSISSGIRCDNSSPDTDTHLLVAQNSVEDCGAYGIYLEHHDGARVTQNSVSKSELSGILISTVQGALIDGNLVQDSAASGAGGQAGICLINGAANVYVRGNRIGSTQAGMTAIPAVRDSSTGGGHHIAPDGE